MKVTNRLRLAAVRAQKDGKVAVAQVVGSTKTHYNVRLVQLDEIIEAEDGATIGGSKLGKGDTDTTWVPRVAYSQPIDGVIPGHRVLLALYDAQSLADAWEHMKSQREVNKL
jgi:hypothetical protein